MSEYDLIERYIYAVTKKRVSRVFWALQTVVGLSSVQVVTSVIFFYLKLFNLK